MRFPLLSCFCLTAFVPLVATQNAQATPDFAKKYEVNCTFCHTRVPRLNRAGKRLFEKGYRLLGTEDRGAIKKSLLGDLALDGITNYLGFRLRVISSDP